MSRFTSLVRADWLPRYPDLGLLVLRLWVGSSLILLHGVGKVERLLSGEATFRSVFGLDPVLSLSLAVLGEVIAPALLLVGLGTRWAALLAAITMATAFVVGHDAALSGERSGELAFAYLGSLLAILFAGPGRLSLDGAGRAQPSR